MLPTAGLAVPDAPAVADRGGRYRARGARHVLQGRASSSRSSATAASSACRSTTSPRPSRWAPAARSRNVAAQAAARHRDGVQRRRAVRRGPDGAARHPPPTRRRRDAAPGAGRRPAAPSAACRPTTTAGSPRSWRRPRIRRPTRSTPAATCSGVRSIDRIPTGRPVSVEREVFPALLSDGLRVCGLRGRVVLARHGHAGGFRAWLGRPGPRHRAVTGARRPQRARQLVHDGAAVAPGRAADRRHGGRPRRGDRRPACGWTAR